MEPEEKYKLTLTEFQEGIPKAAQYYRRHEIHHWRIYLGNGIMQVWIYNPAMKRIYEPCKNHQDAL